MFLRCYDSSSKSIITQFRTCGFTEDYCRGFPLFLVH
uniref:Uncharacterized protein n=1 Tax=Arundo donax TaxID=35708 RepID=A0A0A9S7E8_ARUDO